MTRKTKLEKALKVKRDLFVADDSPGVRAMRVNNELAPLHAALIEAVEALEILNSQLRPIGRYSDQAESALAKIDEALKKEK